ncbi:MAG: 16S rRNA (uracil(1498)-N(3))-methyltransferase [Desulfitobacteriaceae bacterium]|nr:16S rRNA (uracil(1498)-N(3))-methyltransferase [Desulfitobacteriaceae bacterium]MDD4752686.1 16S rRNA (uracil(1498)-N(3))-methyltransferase [Desulfitobacteriaceae bacterium]
MARFFVESDQVENGIITIAGTDVHHIGKVLRLKAGDLVEVADGIGNVYQAELQSVSVTSAVFKILSTQLSRSEPEVEVYLLQGLPKGEKFDFIIQKCTEIGIKKIIPITTERSIVKLTPEKGEKRLKRWQRIASEAAKQSGRGSVPEVYPVMEMGQAIEMLPPGTVIIMPWEGEREISLKKVLTNVKPGSSVALVIGPEGGFAQEEVVSAQKAGAQVVSLGPRILRTETAGMVTLAIVLYELGDLGGCQIG